MLWSKTVEIFFKIPSCVPQKKVSKSVIQVWYNMKVSEPSWHDFHFYNVDQLCIHHLTCGWSCWPIEVDLLNSGSERHKLQKTVEVVRKYRDRNRKSPMTYFPTSSTQLWVLLRKNHMYTSRTFTSFESTALAQNWFQLPSCFNPDIMKALSITLPKETCEHHTSLKASGFDEQQVHSQSISRIKVTNILGKLNHD